MLDPKTLMPAVQKLVPQYSPQEVMAGIQEFQQAHPDADNRMALQALTSYLSQEKQAAPASDGKPFEGLMNQFGGK